MLCPNNRENWTKSPISQFAISAKLISFKTIELNRFSIFLQEIFKINVEVNFGLKFPVEFWVRPLKKLTKYVRGCPACTDEHPESRTRLKVRSQALVCWSIAFSKLSFTKKLGWTPPPPPHSNDQLQFF